MRSDISIQGIAPVTSTGDPEPDSRDASPSTSGGSSGGMPPIYANPALRLEPALGLVVIEFRNSSGDVTSSIPTQRQIQAYKKHALASEPVDWRGAGATPPAPAGRGAPVTSSANPPDPVPSRSSSDGARATDGDGAATSLAH